jgi:hypothetical protein
MSKFLIFIASLFLLSSINAYSFANKNNIEYKVKAAYLYNFTKFITWPSDILSATDKTSLNICILGQDPFAQAINSLMGKTVQGYKVRVEYIDNIKNRLQCQVIFIARSKQNKIKEILEELSTEKILTVSDIEGFAMLGGCISLNVLRGKVRFYVNLQATKKANLEVSAKLLELAERVIE